MPSLGCVLQAKLHAKKAAAFDVYAACSGFLYGCPLPTDSSGAACTRPSSWSAPRRCPANRLGGPHDCVLWATARRAVVQRHAASGHPFDAPPLRRLYGDVLHIPGGGAAHPARTTPWPGDATTSR